MHIDRVDLSAIQPMDVGATLPSDGCRNYVSDTALFIPRRPWLAASEVFGMNMAVWTFDRFLMNEDFAKINGHTIKQNFKTGPDLGHG